MQDTEAKVKKPKVSISKIRFSGGQVFDFEDNEKILIVGPNNSGKSEFLREVIAIICWQNKQIRFEDNKVVKHLELGKEGSLDDLRAFLEENAIRKKEQIDYQSYRIHTNNLSHFSQTYLGAVGQIFCKNLGAEGRLSITAVQNGIGADGHKSKPQHLMYDDQDLMKNISDLFNKSFQQELFMDYRASPQLPIHVGTPPDIEKIPNQVSNEYVEEVRKNPRLDGQGDGMRSYAGILFEVVAIEHDITLLDEPEAFLHPPQMRRLGETLAEEAANQILVSTHSSDILRGFLNGAGGAVRIIRLQRDNDLNNATMTSPARINELWDQPELRYSNALDGIFHEQVIICEDDSDCRLYNSIADHLGRIEPQKKWPDTAYIPSGGKSAIPKIAQALCEMGVTVKVVADIDILNDSTLLRALIEAVGGEWEAIEGNWNRLDAAVRDGVPALSDDEIGEKIKVVLDESHGGRIPKSEIQALLRQTSPWAMIKKYGRSHIPRGDAQSLFEELDEKLREFGVFAVPVGEVENFCPDVGSHGPKFVSKLFSSTPLDDPKLEDLRSFISKVFGNER